MSAYRSADPEVERDGAVADLLHAETRFASARGAFAGAEVRAGAIQAEAEPVAHAAHRVPARVDRVPALSHARRSPRRLARARTRSRGVPRPWARVRRPRGTQAPPSRRARPRLWAGARRCRARVRPRAR